VIITTAGFNTTSPCYEEREVVVNVLTGVTQNDTIFGIIFTLDKDDDWRDKTKWIKAAPNIGETPTWEFMESEYAKACEGISKEVEFKTKLLNIWTNAGEGWIEEEEFQFKKLDINDFKNMPAVGGLDLAYARSGDIIAYTLYFPDTYQFICYYFCSTEKAKLIRSDGVNYGQWVRDGHIIAIEGNTIDYDFVKQKIYETAAIVDLKAITYDRFNSSQLVVDLTKEHITMLPFGQGFISMNNPICELERLVRMQRIIIDDNPVTRWQLNNVMPVYDAAGNVKFDKGNKKKKIDGPVTMAMALGGALDKKIGENIYQGDGPVVL
jgi:phage terminase large subunit-like protein